MGRFLLGVLTGLAALVAPLMIATLTLPGPVPVVSGDRSGPSNPDRVTSETGPVTGGPTRHAFQNYGFAIDTPAGWYTIRREDRAAMDLRFADAFGLNWDSLLLFASDADDPDTVGVWLLISAGPAAAPPPVAVLLAEERIARQALPNSRTIVAPEPVTLGAFSGAWTRSVLDVQQNNPDKDLVATRYVLETENGRLVIDAFVIAGGTGRRGREQIQPVLSSLRRFPN